MDKLTAIQPAWHSAVSSRNLSLRSLSRNTGISRTYLIRIMSGLAVPSEQIRIRLINYFEDSNLIDLFGPLHPVNRSGSSITCKRCNSDLVRKYGSSRGIQRYQCTNCGTVFVHNLSPLHSRLPVEAVVTVLDRFFSGEPLDSIRKSIRESMGISITVTGLEKLIYRYSLKAVEVAADIMPDLSSRWILEASFIEGVRPIVILDLLDSRTGFIISSDVLPDYSEKDRESVIQKALRVSGSIPEIILLAPTVSEECPELTADLSLPAVEFSFEEHLTLSKFTFFKYTRALLLSRRLNFDSLVNCRLICEAWRISHNFLSGNLDIPDSPYHSWLDIVNELNLCTKINTFYPIFKLSNSTLTKE